MKKVAVEMVLGALIFSGCAGLIPESKEEKMLRMQQEHELKMKQLEMRQNQSADERLQDDVMKGINQFLFGVSKQ